MSELILITFYWLHILATVVWIGGIIFILFIAIPSSRQVLGAEAGKLMGEISKRFTPLANYSIFLLVITGVGLAGFNKQFSGIRLFENNWTNVLSLKCILVLGMVIIHFYRVLILTPKIGKTEPVSEKASLQKLSLNLVKVNFGFGMLVLLLSGILRVL